MPMRRRTLAFSVAAVLFAAGQADAASLSLRPAIAPPGATVAVEGAGWRAGSAVTVRRRGGAALARAVGGPTGSWPRACAFRAASRSARNRFRPAAAAWPSTRRSGWSRRLATGRRARSPPRPASGSTSPRTVAFPAAPVRIDVRGLHARGRRERPVARRPGGDGPGRPTRQGHSAARRPANARGGLDPEAARRAHPPRGALLRAAAPDRRASASAADPPVPVLAAAGDIACEPGPAAHGRRSAIRATRPTCWSPRQPDVVAALGDDQYDSGAPPTSGRSYELRRGAASRPRTRPAVGNHEYNTPGAAGYFRYFGAAAGAPDRG